jgi:GntR family transcriptional regulator/MocR family aminotransferase
VQLGVSRGTVRLAYERLIDEQLALGLGAAGTRVTERRSAASASPWSAEAPPMPDLFHDFGTSAAALPDGRAGAGRVPLQAVVAHPDARGPAQRLGPVGYPDPRGDPALRKEVAAYLGIARGCAAARPRC